MAIIPIKIKSQRIDVDKDIEDLTFKELELKEAHLEEFIRANIGQLFGDEESLLIVGQQVVDQEGSRSDLVAIDHEGSLVLIEIKRDVQDIKSRNEALESQAIRYAASLALVKDPKDLVDKMFANYIEKHKSEEPFNQKLKELSSHELASRDLHSFLEQNNVSGFNKSQRIILIASEYDEITLSSSLWLIKNGVDLSCYQLKPARIDDQLIIEFQRLLPFDSDEDFFVDIHASREVLPPKSRSQSSRTRRNLPRMNVLFEWGVIKAGDSLHIKNYKESEAIVVDHRTVNFQGNKVSYNEWGRAVTGWSSICIYEWAVLTANGKTLHDIRSDRLGSEAKLVKKSA